MSSKKDCIGLSPAKLRAWLSCPDCPPTIKECKVLFDQAYHVHGPLSSDLDDIDTFDNVRTPETSNVTHAPEDLEKLIHWHKVVLHACVKSSQGIVYSRCTTHVGNSLILFHPNGNRALTAIPGSIAYIYEEEGSLHFAVQRQHALPTSMADPFSAYPHFPARMFSSTLETKLEHVKISWVLGHHARWSYLEDTVVVLSLCWVCSIIIYCEIANYFLQD